MNFSRRLLCLLLCFTLLCSVFSITASASDTSIPDSYNFLQESYIKVGNASNKISSLWFYVNDGEEQKSEVTTSNYKHSQLKSSSSYINFYHLVYDDESVIMKEDKNYKVSLSNVYFSALINTKNPFYVRSATVEYIEIVYVDDSKDTITECTVTQKANTPYFNLSFEFTPKKDVRKIMFKASTSISAILGSTDTDYVVPITVYHGEILGDDRYQFALEMESEEAGLLKGVISWLKGIKDGITNLFQSIAELPTKLWELISNGLKSLFVPTAEYIQSFKMDIDDLLAEKFGALYQVVDITYGSWDTIMDNVEKSTVDIPEVTIPLPDDNEFSFGGYTVQVIPEGFEGLANTVKSVTGMVSVWLFVSGLKKRYDEIMTR